MSADDKRDQLRLGFMTAIQLPERGYVGGLLVTNRFGRPLEFQCTTPVKPNRTQELLYGPTLVPFILGELVSRTLVEKVGVKPHLILTDRQEILDLRNHTSIPVACLVDADTSADKTSDASTPHAIKSESAASSNAREATLSLGSRTFRIHNAHPADFAAVEKRSAAIAADADLYEPIERVREALNETLNVNVAR